MAFDRKPASAKRDLQRYSPTFVKKLREIFERHTHKSKALKVMYFLSRSIGVVFGLSSLFYQHRFPHQGGGFTSQYTPVGWGFVKICNDVKSNPHLGLGWGGPGVGISIDKCIKLIMCQGKFANTSSQIYLE